MRSFDATCMFRKFVKVQHQQVLQPRDLFVAHFTGPQVLVRCFAPVCQGKSRKNNDLDTRCMEYLEPAVAIAQA